MQFLHNLKNIRICMIVLVLATAVLFASGLQAEENVIRWSLLIASGLCLIVLIAFTILRWRCPHCGEHLGRLDAKHDYCPHCGGKL